MRELKGTILTPQGFVRGGIAFDDTGRIERVSGTAMHVGAARDSAAPIILPGFIDLHVHGGGGRDIMEGGDAAVLVAGRHAAHGTTALLATTMTAPMADLETAFAGLRA